MLSNIPSIRHLHAFIEWLLSSSLSRIVLAIKSVGTGETLERWQFDIYTDESALAPLPGGPPKSAGSRKKEKTEKEVQGEIREIMKQITSSVTFLPILEEQCGSCNARKKAMLTLNIRF